VSLTAWLIRLSDLFITWDCDIVVKLPVSNCWVVWSPVYAACIWISWFFTKVLVVTSFILFYHPTDWVFVSITRVCSSQSVALLCILHSVIIMSAVIICHCGDVVKCFIGRCVVVIQLIMLMTVIRFVYMNIVHFFMWSCWRLLLKCWFYLVTSNCVQFVTGTMSIAFFCQSFWTVWNCLSLPHIISTFRPQYSSSIKCA